MEQRLRRMIDDMKTVQQTLEQGEWDDPALQGDLREEALEEFRLLLNKVRLLLWSCHLAKHQQHQSASRPLDIYAGYQVVDRLRAHRRQLGRTL